MYQIDDEFISNRFLIEYTYRLHTTKIYKIDFVCPRRSSDP